MRPRVDEVLTAILSNFENDILPTIADPLAKSYSYTVANLLRHAILRLELEPQALATDIHELDLLIAQISSFVSTTASQYDFAAFNNSLGNIEDTFPSGSTLELGRLRNQRLDALDKALTGFFQNRAELTGLQGYARLRTQIRDYMRRQLNREATWITTAFTGPRR